jgi:predicted phage baseplate assembly protein
MSLPTAVLDDRTFQDLVDECKRMIPRFTPEWTDHNVSDPGVTLIELFSWLTELLLYRVNQVPRRNYIKFLDLVGVRLEPARPARTEVLFRLTAPQPTAVTIPADTEVATVRTSTEPSLVFATEAPLEIRLPVLLEALVSKDEFTYRDYMPALRNPTLRVPVFEDPPRPGNGFYLGLADNMAGQTLLLQLDCEIEGIGVDPRRPPLAWEYYDGSLRTWRPCLLESDGTGGLNRSGQILVHIPLGSRPRELDGRRATWVRCRVTELAPGQRGYTGSPRLLAASVQTIGGSAMAAHCQVVGTEILGRSNGEPGQVFTLSATPVLPRRPAETVEVEGDVPGDFEPWIEVHDFSHSGDGDPHFTLDSATGQIAFGPAIRQPDGVDRQYGRIPRQGAALRFSRYRTGGGSKGNVGERTLTQLKTSIPYVAWVRNPHPAVGGTEGETIEGAMIRGPQLLRSSPRAVTAEDFERLAGEASPDVARARCTYAKEQDDGLAGSVRLVVVPQITTVDRPVPPEQLALSDTVRTAVQDYLDVRRMITVRLVLGPPQYIPVSVRVEVFAKPRVDKDAVRNAAERALYRFIHPTVGGSDGHGWPFERPLFVSDIYGLLQQVPGVEHLGGVQLVQIENTIERAMTGDSVVVPAGTLPCSAPHVVTVR